MNAILNAASITGQIGAGSIVLNDYALNITPIDSGYRLTVTRGSETQTMDILDGVGIVGIEKTGSTGDVDSYRVTFTDGGTFDYTVETNAASNAAAEAARVDAENGREGAESARASAEAGRVNAENARVAAEAARESAETARASAESARAQAEDGRKNAEAARVASENERAGTEALRAAAEAERANAESGRVAAEQERASAESERVAAETERAETFAGYDARIDAVTPDDNAVDGKPWTSGKIVEALCPPFETTGSIVQCHPVEHYPLGVVSRIDATQSGTGDASPDNIRPIVGWGAVSLDRCGKNLLDLSNAYVAGYNITGISNILKPNTTYSFRVNKSNGIQFAVYIANNPQTNLADKQMRLTKTYVRESSVDTFTTPEDMSEYPYFVLAGNNSGIGNVFPDVEFQLEFGSTATAFEPYQGDTYTATLPETIYGGKLDWDTGILTVTHKHYALPISEMNNNEEYPGWQNVEWVLDLVNDGVDGTLELNACNISTIVRANTRGGRKTIYYTKSDLGGLTQTEIKETYPDLICEFIAHLLNPYTIQLTPQQIAALPGVNTLYTDSGDTAVSGRADPVWLTQSLMERIAALESTATNI